MNRKIGGVRLCFDYYNPEIKYTDGDIEEELLKIVKENNEFDEILNENQDFPIFYHLSKRRENILDVIEFDKEKTVLEIGSGCGALTGALAKKSKKVDCIEISKRRSEINAYKNKNCDNVKIYVGSYEDIDIQEKYDVVTLIGVFEYAKLYISDNTPYITFLKDALSKLKKGGKLYIAIENRLGAKYLSGCVEDHVGKEFAGIEGYIHGEHVRTFSYYEWIEMLKDLDIKNYEFYYPYPDYKFPQYIFSDEFLPNKAFEFEKASNYSSKRHIYFSEDKFYRSLINEKEYRLFANSYLIGIER